LGGKCGEIGMDGGRLVGRDLGFAIHIELSLDFLRRIRQW
jgi:hypothetical protein